jgi:hypothetical protein
MPCLKPQGWELVQKWRIRPQFRGDQRLYDPRLGWAGAEHRITGSSNKDPRGSHDSRTIEYDASHGYLISTHVQGRFENASGIWCEFARVKGIVHRILNRARRRFSAAVFVHEPVQVVAPTGEDVMELLGFRIPR